MVCVVDLVPKENVERWIRYLQLEFPVVAFKASTQIVDKTVVGGSPGVTPRVVWRTEKVEQPVLL